MKDNVEYPAHDDVSEELICRNNDEERALIEPPESLNLVDLNTFEASSESEWLLENAIPSEYYTGLYGEGGMGKSYVANYLGLLACIGGQKFCGLSFPDRRINTLLLDYELNPEQQKKRLTQISVGLGLASIPDNFKYSQPIKGIQGLIPDIIRYLESREIELIIVDSLGAAGVDPLDVNKYINFANTLRELKITSLIIDHQAKQQFSGSYGDKSAYGTVYKRNLARSEFQILGRATSENILSIEMAHKKANFGKKLDQMNFNIVFGESEITFEGQSVINPDEQDSTLIVNAIRNLQDQAREPNQTVIVAELNGILSKHRVPDLLNKGEDVLWNVKRGDRNSKIYELIEPEE